MASGAKKSIKVKVHIIGQFIVQTRFVCQFNIEGRVTSVNAQLLGDTIYCDPMEFVYTSKSPNLTATFAVIWGGSKPLDNPDNIHGNFRIFSSILSKISERNPTDELISIYSDIKIMFCFYLINSCDLSVSRYV